MRHDQQQHHHHWPPPKSPPFCNTPTSTTVQLEFLDTCIAFYVSPPSSLQSSRVAVIAAAAAVAAVVVAAGRAAGGPFEWTREDIEHCLIRTLVSGMRWLMADISSSGAALAIGRRHEAPSCSCSRTPCGPAIPPLQYHCRTMGDSNATMNNATTS